MLYIHYGRIGVSFRWKGAKFWKEMCGRQAGSGEKILLARKEMFKGGEKVQGSEVEFRPRHFKLGGGGVVMGRKKERCW